MHTLSEITYICKLGEDQKRGLHPKLEWFLSPKLSEDQKKGLHPELERFFLPEKFIAQCKNLCAVNLCACAVSETCVHAHSLEGTLVTRILLNEEGKLQIGRQVV